jgi:hypothetical protein
MTHPVDLHRQEAAKAIAAMQAAARAARIVHARAELLRHMQTTAAKMRGLNTQIAAAKVRGEWMKAWRLDANAYPALGEAMQAFAAAFCRDADGSTQATQGEILHSLETLERGFAAIGTSLSEQMALNSECAHGWWAMVAPQADGQAFWENGCPPHCR